jgi:hypothetical protein
VRPLRGRGPDTRGGGEGSDKRPEVKSFEYWWYCIATPENNVGEGAMWQVAWGVELIYECEIAMTTQLDRLAREYVTARHDSRDNHHHQFFFF